MNRNNCRLIRLAVLLLLSSIVSDSHAQLKRNVLHVYFQTAVLKPTTTDTVLNVYYRIEAYSPVTFTGFDCSFNYDQTKVKPIQAFFSGTASGDAGHWNNNSQTHNFYVLADNSPHSLDTTKPILFQIQYLAIAAAIKDSAMITPNTFEAGGFDSVSIENTTWDPTFQWHSFGLLFADTAKPPPPKKVNITLSTDSVSIDTTSLKTISVMTTKLDSANIKSATFEFSVDTSIFDSVGIAKGVLLTNASFTVLSDTNPYRVSFLQADTIKGEGELLKIVLRGRKRADTVCTSLLAPKLTASNSDEMLNSVLFDFGQICVFGKKADTVAKGIVADGKSNTGIEIFPNPARSFIDFVLPSGQELRKHCQVFDMLGRKMLDITFDSGYRWDFGQIPAGVYSVEISDLSSGTDRKNTGKGKILIIH